MKRRVESSCWSYGFEAEERGRTREWVRQVHGTEMNWFDGEAPAVPPEGDAVGTRLLARRVHVFTADCMPVLFYQEKSHSVAAVHAGWRGLKSGLVSKAVSEMGGPAGLRVVIGPSIQKCCFEVKDDFVEAFQADAGNVLPYLENRSGKRYFDLLRFALEHELVGIPTECIELSNAVCTYCALPLWPSFRRNGHTQMRIRNWIEATNPR